MSLNFDNVQYVSYKDGSILIPPPPVDQSKEPFVSHETFLSEIDQVISCHFGSEFDWNNLMIVGESVLDILIGNPSKDGIQLHIYDADPALIIKRMQYICRFFSREKHRLITLSMNRQKKLVMTIHSPNQLPIQIYAIPYQCKEDVINFMEFPLDQVAYTGETLICSDLFKVIIISQTISLENKSTLDQILTAYQSGFCVSYQPHKDLPIDLPSRIEKLEREDLRYPIDPDQQKKFINSYYNHKNCESIMFLNSDRSFDIQQMIDFCFEN